MFASDSCSVLSTHCRQILEPILDVFDQVRAIDRERFTQKAVGLIEVGKQRQAGAVPGQFLVSEFPQRGLELLRIGDLRPRFAGRSSRANCVSSTAFDST